MATAAELRTIPCVYRYFSEAIHADALVRGEVWISTLDACRKYEKMGRGDPDEGTLNYRLTHLVGDYETPGFLEMTARAGIVVDAKEVSNLQFTNCRSTEKIEDAFVICATERMAATTSATFGPYCVEIRRPVKFFELVTNQLARMRPVKTGWFDRVTYAAREYIDSSDPPAPAGFLKAPDVYADQREIRLLWLPTQTVTDLKPFTMTVAGVSRLCRRIV